MMRGRLPRVLRVPCLAIATCVGIGLAGTGPALAADTWTYDGWFTLDGRANWVNASTQQAGYDAKQLDVYVSLRVENGLVVDGIVTAGQCLKQPRSATVTFSGVYEDCKGTITFAGLGTANLSIASVDLVAPPNDTTFGVDFNTAPTTVLAGLNLNPSKPKLPPLAPPVLSVTTGVVDPVRQIMQARVSVALPQGYPSVTQVLTRQSAGSAAAPIAADSWTDIPCGVPTTFTIVVTGSNTDPATQSTATTYTPNCSPRTPTLALVTQTADTATFSYQLSDGGPVESATWTATGQASPPRSGTATPPGGGNGADFTVTNLAPGSRTRVSVMVISAGGQSKQSNIIEVWSAAPAFSYPPIVGKVGVPIKPTSPSPVVDTGTVTKLRPGSSLPPGLQLDPATGVISGTPTAASTGQADLVFAYAGSSLPGRVETSRNAISFAVAGRGTEPVFGAVNLVGEVGVPISPVPIAGSIVNLPTGARFASPAVCDLGLRLDPSTGIISGTPMKSSVSTGTSLAYYVVSGGSGDGCAVTGSPIDGRGPDGSPARFGGLSTSISAPAVPRLWYSPGMATSKQVHGTVGSPLTVPGPMLAGAVSATFAVTSGTLPRGLTLDIATGAIAGVPTTAGSGITVTLSAKDANGKASNPVTIAFDISAQPVNAVLAYPSPILVRVGQALSVSPSGAIAGQSFALDKASLAAGLAIDAKSGRVTWTPGAAQVGSRAVWVTATAPGQAPTTVPLKVSVALDLAAALRQGSGSPGTGSSTSGSSTSGSAGLAATASTGSGGASSGTVGSRSGTPPCLPPSGQLYDDMVGSVGSTMTYAPNTVGLGRPASFRVTGGALPSGVVLDTTYGVISGTPRHPNAGIGPVVIQATFAGGTVLTSSVNIAVDDPHQSVNYPNRVIGTVGSPTAIIPESFDTHGGTTYTLVCGELPAGMSLDPASGVISGTPTAPVDYPTPLRVRQRDSHGTVDASLIMVVDSAPTPWIRYPEHPIAAYRHSVTITPTISQLPAQTTFRLEGILPKGLSFESRTGVIAGQPVSLAQNRPLTVTAIGPDGQAIAATSTSISVRKATVPLSVTARHSNAQLGTKQVVLVSRSRHPNWTTAVTRVDCNGCVARVNARSGKVVVVPGQRTTRVKVTITATSKQGSNLYRPHVWTRTWFIRKR